MNRGGNLSFLIAALSLAACTVGKDGKDGAQGVAGVPCNGCVTPASLAPGAVTGVALQDGSVGTPALAAQSVTGAILADGAVITSKFAPAAVDSAALASGAVTTAAIAPGAVDGTVIADGAVSTNKIAASAVDSTAIAPGAVGTVQLANGAVGTNQLADSSVTNAKLAAGAVSSANIAPRTITGANIALGTLVEANANLQMVGSVSSTVDEAVMSRFLGDLNALTTMRVMIAVNGGTGHGGPTGGAGTFTVLCNSTVVYSVALEGGGGSPWVHISPSFTCGQSSFLDLKVRATSSTAPVVIRQLEILHGH